MVYQQAMLAILPRRSQSGPVPPRALPVPCTASAFALTFALALALAPRVAGAQCDAGDAGPDPSLTGVLRDVFPADGDLGVPTDGLVRLRYFGRTPDSPTVCVRPISLSDCVPGTAAVLGSQLVWQGTPLPGGADPLTPQTDYQVTFTDASGGTNRTTFRTGRGHSGTSPSFQGITSVSAIKADTLACDPDAVDVTVQFDRVPPSDLLAPGTPWPDIDVEYVVYETRGPGISGPRERDRARLVSSGSSTDLSAQRTFRLSGHDAAGPVCFTIQAVDPAGQSDGNRAEQCVNPAQGNYFAGCRAAPGAFPGGSRGGALALAAVAVALSTRRLRRLRRRAG